MRVLWKKRTFRSSAVAMTAIALVALAVSDARTRAQSPPAGADRDDAGAQVFSADVAITNARVDEGGRRLPGAPSVTLRVAGTRTTAGWRTSMTLTGVERPLVRTPAGLRELDHPFLATSAVYDAQGGLRLHNAKGQRVDGSLVADRSLVRSGADSAKPDWELAADASGLTPPVPADWSPRLLTDRRQFAERRVRLHLTFGAPIERVAGMDRYLASRDDRLEEVLVDPLAVVPVEVNTMVAGALAVHTRIGYDAHGPDLLVRRRLVVERLNPGARGGRTITTVDVTNVTVSPEVSR